MVDGEEGRVVISRLTRSDSSNLAGTFTLIAFGLLLHSGCMTSICRIPGIDIDVKQINGDIVFSFNSHSRETVTISSLCVFTKDDPNVVLAEGNEHILWQIESINWPTLVHQCHYGTVPTGFLQRDPQTGCPPDLSTGVTYFVSCSGMGMGARTFTIVAQKYGFQASP